MSNDSYYPLNEKEYLSLLNQIVSITQNASEAIDIGNEVYNLLYEAGLVS